MYKYIIIFTGILFIGCYGDTERIIKVDFSKKVSDSSDVQDADSISPLRVAVAAILSPGATFSLYEDLFSFISKKINRPVKFEQRKTYSEINDLIVQNKVDIAFICTGAYQKIIKNCDILAVPVCNGLPYYRAYILINMEAPFESLADLRNKSFAFTDEHSLSGRKYADDRIKKLAGIPSENFFSRIIYTHAHDISIQMVSKNLVDGATVDCLIYDYIKKTDPQKVKNIMILEKSPYFGIPPVVCSKKINPELKSKLTSIFLDFDKERESRDILRKLMIDQFIQAGDTLYQNTIL